MPTPLPAFVSRCRSRRKGGFTLVEIMAAIAITILLMLFFSIFLDTATVLISTSEKHLNADAQARLVFDRMQLDIAGMVKRKDISQPLFSKQAGNDSFYFYSAAPGYYGSTATTTNETDLSLVGYAIGGSGSTYGVNQLQRYGEGQTTGINLFDSPIGSSPPSFTDTNYHVLAPSVFRLEIAFLVRENNQNFEIMAGTGTSPADTLPPLGNYRNEGDQGYPNLWAILVDIAALDTTGGVTLTPAQYTTLIAALPDFPSTTSPVIPSPQTLAVDQAPSSTVATTSMDPILNSWSAAIQSPTFYQTAQIPRNAAQQVRVYERAFYLQ